MPKIKGFSENSGAMAALCTSSETFKIKKAENTNKMFILDIDKESDLGAEIMTVTSI
jgi:hypothetical protein